MPSPLFVCILTTVRVRYINKSLTFADGATGR